MTSNSPNLSIYTSYPTSNFKTLLKLATNELLSTNLNSNELPIQVQDWLFGKMVRSLPKYFVLQLLSYMNCFVEENEYIVSFNENQADLDCILILLKQHLSEMDTSVDIGPCSTARTSNLTTQTKKLDFTTAGLTTSPLHSTNDFLTTSATDIHFARYETTNKTKQVLKRVKNSSYAASYSVEGSPKVEIMKEQNKYQPPVGTRFLNGVKFTFESKSIDHLNNRNSTHDYVEHLHGLEEQMREREALERAEKLRAELEQLEQLEQLQHLQQLQQEEQENGLEANTDSSSSAVTLPNPSPTIPKRKLAPTISAPPTQKRFFKANLDVDQNYDQLSSSQTLSSDQMSTTKAIVGKSALTYNFTGTFVQNWALD